jgi:hypothetical protein
MTIKIQDETMPKEIIKEESQIFSSTQDDLKVSSYFMCFAWVYLRAYLGNEILKRYSKITQNQPKRLVGFFRLGT